MSAQQQGTLKKIPIDLEQKRKRMIVFIVIISFLAGTAAVIGVYKPMVKEQGLPVVKGFTMLDYFPVREGSSWSYRHRAGSYGTANDALVDKGDYHIRVEKLYQNRYYSLAVMRGDPFNMAPDDKNGYLITGNRVYFLDDKQTEKFEMAVREHKRLPTELLPESPLFEFPLYEGLRWGPVDNLLSGSKGVYSVEQEQYLQLTRGKKEPIYRAYMIKYSDTDKGMQILYSPGLGIVSVTRVNNNQIDKSVLFNYSLTKS